MAVLVEDDADLFEASLMVLAGTTTLRQTTTARRRDDWAVVSAAWADVPLRVEFETEHAAARFTEVMHAVPDTNCWTRRREAGIRRRYETFVVDVEAAEPSSAVDQLYREWRRTAALLLGDRAADQGKLRARAAAVWRSALLTTTPRHSGTGMRLRAHDRPSLRLLLRAAQVLGVNCEAHTGSGRQIVSVEGRGALILLSTRRGVPKAVTRGPRA